MPKTKKSVKHREYQVNFRCEPEERRAYKRLAEKLDEPLSFIIRRAMNKLVARHLGKK